MQTNVRKRNAKKLAALLLAIALMLGIVPVIALADDGDVTSCIHVCTDGTCSYAAEVACTALAAAHIAGCDEACAEEHVHVPPCDAACQDPAHIACEGDTHNSACTYAAEVACDHVCSQASGCITPAPASPVLCSHGTPESECSLTHGGGIGTRDVTGEVGLSFTTTPTGNFQTYNTGAGIPRLMVNFTVAMGSDNIANAAIKLPLDSLCPDGYTINKTGGGTESTTPIPFFNYDAATSDLLANPAVASASVVGTDLVIVLKDSLTQGSYPIAVYFTFDERFANMVPSNTTLWTLKPASYVAATVKTTPAQVAVVGGNSSSLSVSVSAQTAGAYSGGPISVRARWSNLYWQYADFDPNYTNYLYIDIPKNSTLNSHLSGYFTATPVDVDVNGNDVGVSGLAAAYTRYMRIVKPNSEEAVSNATTWTSPAYGGNRYDCFTQMDVGLTPTSMVDGDTIKVRVGAVYRKVNGTEQRIDQEIAFTQTPALEFALYLPETHYTGGMHISTVTMNGSSTANAIGSALFVGGYGGYHHAEQIKNKGSEAASGVSMVLGQTTGNSSPIKLAFNSIAIQASRRDGNVAWASYKVEVFVKNFTNNNERNTTESFNPNASAAFFNVSLPALGAGEYIDRVVVTPMGVVGGVETAGEWPALNSFCIIYKPISWANDNWPDGTAIGNYAAVEMGWELRYNDNNNPATPAVFHGAHYNVIYTRGATSATAKLVSSQAGTAMPGQAIEYFLEGQNNQSHPVVGWQNPRITVRVPKALSVDLIAIGAAGGLKIEGTNTPVSVSQLVAQSNASATYNYYHFSIDGYTAPKMPSTTPSFRVKIPFRVATSALAGTYPINQVLVSSDNPSNFYQVSFNNNVLMNNLSPADAAIYGAYAERNYSAITTGSTSLVVAPAPGMRGYADVSGPATGGNYVTNPTVPANAGGTVKMRLNMLNTGTTTMENIRLYDILPSATDGRPAVVAALPLQVPKL